MFLSILFIYQGDTVRVIWALHDRDPPHGAEMLYHGEKRGSQSLHLLGPPPVPKMLSGNSRQWDVVFEDVSEARWGIVKSNLEIVVKKRRSSLDCVIF